MIRRLYVHNYRCLENFELLLGELPTVLLLGRNGSGKTTVGHALKVLRDIALGNSRVGELVRTKDLAGGRTGVPMRFEVEATLDGRVYSYSVAFELPSHFRELRVKEEILNVDGEPVFSRALAQVRLWRTSTAPAAEFRIDWHQVALAIIQEQSAADPLAVFKRWLGASLILRPVPALARGNSDQLIPWSRVPDDHVSNLGEWFSAMVSATPAAYPAIVDYLQPVMPDFREITNRSADSDGSGRSLTFHFGDQLDTDVALSLEDLSDGEKCFVIFALTIAARKAHPSLLCFWDEPDNYLSPDEVGHAVTALRSAFHHRGQLIVTSHNPEAIERFSDESSLYLQRTSHAEPTQVRSIADLRESSRFAGGLANALVCGDLVE